jgi:hypothetical protein
LVVLAVVAKAVGEFELVVREVAPGMPGISIATADPVISSIPSKSMAAYCGGVNTRGFESRRCGQEE